MRLWQKFVGGEQRSLSLDGYLELLKYAGNSYVLSGAQTTLGARQEEIPRTLIGFTERLFEANPVIHGCLTARLSLFSEARFKYRRLVLGRPGELFGTKALKLLEEPWPEASTSDLLKRMEIDSVLMGNFFGAKRTGGRIMRLNPEWVTIVLGSPNPNVETGFGDIDVEPIGYVYQPGGKAGGREPIALLPNEVAHFAPIPDPRAAFRGLSPLTALLRDATSDQAATEHKQSYLEEGAVPGMVVKSPEVDAERFEVFKELFEEKHGGLANRFKTIFLGGGADVEVVGSDLKQVDFKAVQAITENRICVALRVPSIIAGVSEGLEASTYSNVQQAKRIFADGTIRPLWRDACAALAPLIRVPAGAELWYDDRDIAYLQEDQKDEAEVQQKQAVTIAQLVKEGFEPASVVDAVTANDMGRLQHTGLVSVQLQPPGTEQPNSNGSGDPGSVPAPNESS